MLCPSLCEDGNVKHKNTAASAGQTTAEPVTAPAVTVLQRNPEWIRLPKTGNLCPLTGLTRSKMNELILPCAANENKPPVRSVVLRQRGKIKGVRLVSFDSLIAHIRQQAEEQMEGQVAA